MAETKPTTDNGQRTTDAGMPVEVKKAIEGLEFRAAQGEQEVDPNTGQPRMRNGRTIMRYHPHRRAMTEGDVLSWRKEGSALIIVSKDGMKHVVKAKGSAA